MICDDANCSSIAQCRPCITRPSSIAHHVFVDSPTKSYRADTYNRKPANENRV